MRLWPRNSNEPVWPHSKILFKYHSNIILPATIRGRKKNRSDYTFGLPMIIVWSSLWTVNRSKAPERSIYYFEVEQHSSAFHRIHQFHYVVRASMLGARQYAPPHITAQVEKAQCTSASKPFRTEKTNCGNNSRILRVHSPGTKRK